MAALTDDLLAAALSAITTKDIAATKPEEMLASKHRRSSTASQGNVLENQEYFVELSLNSLHWDQLIKGKVQCEAIMIEQEEIDKRIQLGQVIYVETLTGKTLVFDYDEKYTIEDVKVKICVKEGTPPNQQILVFAGKRLRDACLLVDYRIHAGSTLLLLLHLSGGGPSPTTIKHYLSPHLRDPFYDFDFTKVKDSLTYYRGLCPYRRPCGWMRIALNVLDKYEDNIWLGIGREGETDSAVGEWPVSYHGTGHRNLNSIAEDGFLLSKGKRFEFGYGIYSTPDIDVAEKYGTKFTHGGRNYVTVFQNRVDPDDMRIVTKEDTGVGEYWITQNQRSIRPYGICIKNI